jgi:hypothetical protein
MERHDLIMPLRAHRQYVDSEHIIRGRMLLYLPYQERVMLWHALAVMMKAITN